MKHLNHSLLAALLGASIASSAQAAPAPKLHFEPSLTFEAAPRTSRTQNQFSEGTATSVAFAGTKGSRLLVGASDDRMRSFDSETGSTLWTSPSLGEDVSSVSGCANPAWAFARLVNGTVYVFYSEQENDYLRWFMKDDVPNGHDRVADITKDCAFFVADRNGTVSIYDTKNHEKLAQIPTVKRVHLRNAHLVNGEILLEGENGFESWKVDKPSGPVPMNKLSIAVEKEIEPWPEAASEAAAMEQAAKERGDKSFKVEPVKPVKGQLVQASKLDAKSYLFEYCAADRCKFEITNDRGRATAHYTFKTAGSTAQESDASTWAVSPAGDLLFVHRPGMTARVVTLKTSTPDYLVAIPSTLAAHPSAAFSPDGKKLAVTMYPHSYNVTIFEQKPVTSAPAPAEPANSAAPAGAHAPKTKP